VTAEGQSNASQRRIDEGRACARHGESRSQGEGKRGGRLPRIWKLWSVRLMLPMWSSCSREHAPSRTASASTRAPTGLMLLKSRFSTLGGGADAHHTAEHERHIEQNLRGIGCRASKANHAAEH
jgi:hypothetical protein